MKKFLVYVFAILYIWVSNPILNAVLTFNLNESEIIKNLCDGRFTKENKCQGMCYLNKEVTNTSKKIPIQSFFQFELPSYVQSNQLNIFLSKRVSSFDHEVKIDKTILMFYDVTTPPPRHFHSV